MEEGIRYILDRSCLRKARSTKHFNWLGMAMKPYWETSWYKL